MLLRISSNSLKDFPSNSSWIGDPAAPSAVGVIVLKTFARRKSWGWFLDPFSSMDSAEGGAGHLFSNLTGHQKHVKKKVSRLQYSKCEISFRVSFFFWFFVQRRPSFLTSWRKVGQLAGREFRHAKRGHGKRDVKLHFWRDF